MLINLITAWKERVLPDILRETKDAKTLDKKVDSKSTDSKSFETAIIAQSSFQFDTPPRVIFVKDSKTRSIAANYGALPTVSLLPEEQKIYAQKLAKLQENKKFYNGKQMLLTGAGYDTTNNTLYLEAVQVDYAFLVALGDIKKANVAGSAVSQKEFFKTGVLAPFISKDNNVAIITRKDAWSLRSVAAGFLECKDEKHALTNLIPETAAKEADEEFVHDSRGHRRFDFASTPIITSISFRDAVGTGMTPTIEFVAPIQIKHDSKFMLSVMNNNQASHAHEHIAGSAIKLTLAPYDRGIHDQKQGEVMEFMQKRVPGNFLYGPVLHTCAIQANPGMAIAHRIPEIPNSRFYPIGIFKSAPQQAPTDYACLEAVQNMLTKMNPL